jgi:membrane protein DedA with SNARE-associated domain
VSWWIEIADAVRRLLDQHALPTAFVLLFLEEAGLPPIVPGDFLMMLIGMRAAEHRVSLIWGTLVLELATILGGSVLYWVSRWGGHALMLRFGRYIGATPARLDRASRLLERHGLLAVVFGRLVPTLCIMTAVVSGILELPYRRFAPALAIGGLLHLILMVGLGYFLGPPVLELVARLHPPLGLLTSTVLWAVLTYWIVRVARGSRASRAPDRTRLTSRLRAGLLAGLVASLESSLALNTALGIIGLTVATPGHEGPGLAGDFDQMLTPLIGLLNAPSLPTLALWGAAYGLAVEHEMRITPWLRGVVFALVPLTVSLVAIVPLATWSLLGLPFHELRGPLAIETSRHLIYGLTLGMVYPLLLRRAPDSLPPPGPARKPDEAPDLTAPVA